MFAGRAGAGDAGFHRRELARFGVEPRLAADESVPTGTIVVLVGPDGERTMITDRGANLRLGPADVPAALLDDAALLHLTGYSFFEPGPRAVARGLLAEAARRGVPVTVDPGSAAFLAAPSTGPAAFLGWTRGAAVCFPNVDEAAVLTGADPPPAGDPAAMAAVLTRLLAPSWSRSARTAPCTRRAMRCQGGSRLRPPWCATRRARETRSARGSSPHGWAAPRSRPRAPPPQRLPLAPSPASAVGQQTDGAPGKMKHDVSKLLLSPSEGGYDLLCGEAGEDAGHRHGAIQAQRGAGLRLPARRQGQLRRRPDPRPADRRHNAGDRGGRARAAGPARPGGPLPGGERRDQAVA